MVMILASEEALSLLPRGLALGGEAEIIKRRKEPGAEGARGVGTAPLHAGRKPLDEGLCCFHCQ